MMPQAKIDRFKRLTASWLALVVLTLLSLALSEGYRNAPWLPAWVAVIIGLKGQLVARSFIESHHAHPFISRLVGGFTCIAPLALLATAYCGDTLARWATL